MTASRFGSFLFVGGVLLAGAIAQAQQAPQGPKPTAAAASHPTQKADDQAAAAAAIQADAAKKAADQLVKDARYAGFKPEHIRGTLMFCRTATELGSNFPVRTCYNEDQVKVKIEEYRAQRQQMEQMHSNGVVGN